jgi:hypothetical protein
VSLPSSEVKDTFFAYILGIITTGAEVDMDNEQMREILVEFKSTLNVPFDLISRVAQNMNPETGMRRIELDFQRDVVIPVPFALLFYHPGSIRATRVLSFDVRRSTWADAEVFDLVLDDGSILVDLDEWLVALFSSHLEDTWIRNIVFFTWHGDWVGMLEGRGRSTGRVIRAYFDFTKNTILFPAPDSLKSIGRAFPPG